MVGKLENKIALVTGASSGIGAEVAMAYAKEGAHVILVARSISDLELIDDHIKKSGGTATIVPLDLNNFDKIDELGSIINERFGRLDILVENAAMLGTLSPIAHIDTEIWERVFKLNVTANYRLIRSFDPLLRLSKSGRVICVSSQILNDITPYWGLYSASKSALETIAITYAKEVSKTNIKVNVIRPKATATKMLSEAMPGVDMAQVDQPKDIVGKFIELAEDSNNANGEVFLV